MDEQELEEAFEEYWDRMRSAGALEIDSVDENGEIVYTFNMEVMQSQFPEMWQAHLDSVDKDLLSLQEQGLVHIDFGHPDITIELTDKGRKYMDIINET